MEIADILKKAYLSCDKLLLTLFDPGPSVTLQMLTQKRIACVALDMTLHFPGANGLSPRA